MKTATVVAMASALFFVLILAACGGSSAAQERFAAGAELQERGQLETAIAEYDQAIRLDPENALAYNNRGLTYNNLVLSQP